MWQRTNPFRLLAGIAIAAVLALSVASCGSDDSDEEGTDEASASPCEQVDAPQPKDVKLKAPEASEPTATDVVFTTSCGDFTVTLNAEQAPKTAASFQYLAEEGLYDGTIFHRVASGFVVQGGDPLGTGVGGPGYSIDEQPPDDLSYTEGTVAMAKTANEPPGRSGSQFFIVTAPDAGLPPDYAPVGEVTDGLDTVEAIEALGEPGADGPPSQTVVVETATAE